MKIRVASDLHIDPKWSLPFELPVLPDDGQTVLVIAGDAGEGTLACDHIQQWCDRFRAVILVPGNHEFYHGNLDRTGAKIIAAVDRQNFHLLESNEVQIGDTWFLGTTLWTDFFNQNFECMWDARHAMNDYKMIRWGEDYNRLVPEIILEVHLNQRKWLMDRVAHHRDQGNKYVIVTHHAPSVNSVHPRFAGSRLNSCFYTDLDEYVEGCGAVAWIHGHMHNRSDYMIGQTRVICNARGYHSHHEGEHTEFDPLFHFSA